MVLPCFLAASAGKNLDIQAKPFSTTCRLHLSDRLCLSVLLTSAGWLLLQLWRPAPLEAAPGLLFASHLRYMERQQEPFTRGWWQGETKQNGEMGGRRGQRTGGIFKSPKQIQSSFLAWNMSAVGLIQTVGMVFLHHVLPLCQRTANLYGMRLCKCSAAVALFLSCFPGEMACSCSLMDLFYNPLLQIPSSGRRHMCGTGWCGRWMNLAWREWISRSFAWTELPSAPWARSASWS